jgi:hypothetical protein
LGIRAQSAGKNTAVCGIIILLYFGAYAFAGFQMTSSISRTKDTRRDMK